MARKNTVCLWYDGTALDAARFYAETFPDNAVGAVDDEPGYIKTKMITVNGSYRFA